MDQLKMVFLANVPMAMCHGFIETPVSRNKLVCEEVYGTDYYGAPYFCMTARETLAQFGKGLPPGVPAGDMPGVAEINEPWCSGGPANTHINEAAVKGLNTRGEPTAYWVAGDLVDVTWKVEAAHGGVYSYRVCCDGTDTEECFKKNVLKSDDGVEWFNVTTGLIRFRPFFFSNSNIGSFLSGSAASFYLPNETESASSPRS